MRYEIVLVAKDHAPFEAEPFKVIVRASGLDTARQKAFRLLKRTYGDGTHKGNPMWWNVTEQRGFNEAEQRGFNEAEQRGFNEAENIGGCPECTSSGTLADRVTGEKFPCPFCDGTGDKMRPLVRGPYEEAEGD